MVTYFYTLNNKYPIGCLQDIDNIKTFSWMIDKNVFYSNEKINYLKDDLDRVFTKNQLRKIIESCERQIDC